MVAEFSAELRRARRLSKVVALCNTMLDKFGGVTGFAKVWREQFDAAKQDHPGGKRVLDGLMAILNLMIMLQDSSPQSNPSDMTDEELQSALFNLIDNSTQ
jgi:hypothetical protein